jgi:predicted nucleic acid-binding protein
LSFDVDSALRALKPQKVRAPIALRPDADLRWASTESKGANRLLLDATVYVDTLQGRTPPEVDELLLYSKLHHSAVVLSELSHAVGRLDPADRRTKTTAAAITDAIKRDIPAHKTSAPDAETWGLAGILSGMMLQLMGLPKGVGRERQFLNDSLIYLQARKIGATVLTRNRRDFDCLNQLVPTGAVVFYSRT